MHVQREYVRCGKVHCHCMKGSVGHGPYWYGYWREPGGRVRSGYIGKRLPKGGRRAASEMHPDDVRSRKPDDMPSRFAWNGRRMAPTVALRILGIGSAKRPAVKRAWRKLATKYHPDRAPRGHVREYTRIMESVNVAQDTLLK